MTDQISEFLKPFQSRVDEAEAKREKSRKNPDPIWDASMILAIQASSADVPTLIGALAAAEASLAEMSEAANRVHQARDWDENGPTKSHQWATGVEEAVAVIRAALEGSLEGCECALVGCRHKPMLTTEGRKQVAAAIDGQAALGKGLK
ncbi:hypothetical protein M1D89_10030 [Arthrobacter sp. D3-18]